MEIITYTCKKCKAKFEGLSIRKANCPSCHSDDLEKVSSKEISGCEGGCGKCHGCE